ncbi:unnamed protein product [Withania somnifera]
MVSFASTLPSLVSLIPSPSSISNASRYFSQPGMICCKLGPDLSNEERFCRRDILQSVGAAVGMDLIARSSSFIKVANAADLIQRRQRSEFQSKIKVTLFDAMKANPDIIPSILTLALNDSMTYDKESKKVIDSDSKGGPVSYADLIQFAAQSAVKSTFLASAISKCGGNVEKGTLLYSAYGSNGQWGQFDRLFGRSDTQEADPEGRVPQWDKASVQEMKDKFKAVGLGPRQLAVMSAFLGPDQDATEALLASDPEVLPWIQKYQRSRETVSRTDYEASICYPT